MARKSSGEMTRERILVASLPLFAEHGFAGTSTRMVASAAQVNVATLAYYFDGKEGLYKAVVQRMHEDLQDFAPETPPLSDPSEFPEWVASQAWAFAREHAVHIRLLMRNVLDSGKHVDVVSESSERLLDRGTLYIRPFQPTWSKVRCRLFVLSITHLLARFAVEDREQLSKMAGHPPDLDAAIEDWVAHAVRVNLGLPS